MNLKYPKLKVSKTIKTEISVFGSQALGVERWRSPSLAVKVLICLGENIQCNTILVI